MFNFEKMMEKFEARKLERIRKAYAKMIMEKIFEGFNELSDKYGAEDVMEALSKWDMDNIEEIIEVLQTYFNSSY